MKPGDAVKLKVQLPLRCGFGPDDVVGMLAPGTVGMLLHTCIGPGLALVRFRDVGDVAVTATDLEPAPQPAPALLERWQPTGPAH